MTANPLPLLTDQEIDELAYGIVTNRYYVAADEDAIRCSFGAMLALAGRDWIPPNASSLLYEEWSNAGPRSMNGYPMFLSIRFVPIENVDALIEAVRAKEAALEGTHTYKEAGTYQITAAFGDEETTT